MRNASLNASKHSHKFRRLLRRSQRGQAIVIIALSMIGLLAFLALAIDGSRFFDQRRITQNASDMASLAGVYNYFKESGTVTTMIARINNIAEKNGIPDSDGNAGNAVNTNVTVYAINSTGDYKCADGTTIAYNADPTTNPNCPMTTSSAIPSGMQGLRVRVQLSYVSFFGQFISRSNMIAMADGTALQLVTTYNPPSSQTQYSITTLSSGLCNDASHPAFYYGKTGTGSGNANNTELGDVMVGGAVVAGDTNPSSSGNVSATGPVTNTDGQTTTSTGATLPSPNMASTMYVDVDNPVDPLEVTDFMPDTRDATVAQYVTSGVTLPASGTIDNKLFQRWAAARAAGITVPNYTFIDLGSASANGIKLAALINGGRTGIFYIDGDVEITDSSDGWANNYGTANGISIFADGTIYVSSTNNNSTYGNAGAYARGISLFAGKAANTTDPNAACASAAQVTASPTTWYLKFDGQQQNYKGIMYVPHGLAWFSSNYANGAPAHGPILAQSVAIGLPDSPVNNHHFDDCNSCFMAALDTISLNQ